MSTLKVEFDIFWKNAYLLSCWELDEKMDTTLICFTPNMKGTVQPAAGTFIMTGNR